MKNPDVTEQPEAPPPVACSDLLGASVQYDQSTKLIIMGCLCHMDDVVNVGKVESVATEIMAVMSRRRKPNKAWGVTVSIAPNDKLKRSGEDQ